MRVGKTITTVTSPQRRFKKANERRQPAEQPIPVEIPKKKKVKKEEEVEASVEWRFVYGQGARAAGKNSAILASLTS